VFQKFRGAHLKLNPKKYQLFQKKVWYLRYILSEEMTTGPERLTAVQEWLPPKDKHELRSFLGLCIYYWRLIAGSAETAKLLTQLREEK
jgi:hypothetical protein